MKKYILKYGFFLIVFLIVQTGIIMFIMSGKTPPTPPVNNMQIYVEQNNETILKIMEEEAHKYGSEIINSYFDASEIATPGQLKSPKAYKAKRFMIKAYPEAKLTEMIIALDVVRASGEQNMETLLDYMEKNENRAEMRNIILPLGIQAFPMFYSILAKFYMMTGEYDKSMTYVEKIKKEFPNAYVPDSNSGGNMNFISGIQYANKTKRILDIIKNTKTSTIDDPMENDK